MTIFKSAKVTELEGANATLQAENDRITGELATATATIEANAEAVGKVTALEAQVTELQAANAEIPALNATIEAQKAEIATLTESSKLTAEKIDAAAAAKLVSMGHQEPLDTSGDQVVPDNKAKGLSGFDRVAAAFAKK